MLKSTHITLILILGAVYGGCSKEQEDKRSDASASATAKPAEDTPSEKVETCSGEDCGVQLTSGLPEFCELKTYKGQTCASCIPREIPIVRCGGTLLDETADNSALCHYDKETLSCDDEGFHLEVAYGKQTQKEKYYDNLDQITGGIKLIVGATMRQADTDERGKLYGILDEALKNKQVLFSGGDSSKVLENVLAIFDKYEVKEMTPEKRSAIAAQVKKAIEVLGSDADVDIVTPEDCLAFFRGIMAALRVGESSALESKVNFDKIEATLESNQTKEMVGAFLKSIGNE